MHLKRLACTAAAEVAGQPVPCICYRTPNPPTAVTSATADRLLHEPPAERRQTGGSRRKNRLAIRNRTPLD